MQYDLHGSIQDSVQCEHNPNPLIGGSITSGGWFDAGTSAVITAIPASNYQFTGFAGDLTGTNNPQSLLIDGPKSVTANFSVVNVATTTTLASSLNPSIAGQSVTFTATVMPASGSTTPTGSVSFNDGATLLPHGSACQWSGRLHHIVTQPGLVIASARLSVEVAHSLGAPRRRCIRMLWSCKPVPLCMGWSRTGAREIRWQE